MIRSATGKVMWVGKATVFLVGLAVILALLFGVASTAFAHKGNKGFFHLGHRNVTSNVSLLIKRGAGPALNLRVGSGPPLTVNSSSKVPNLNADKIDGVGAESFLRSSTYWKYQFSQGTPFAGNSLMRRASLSCEEGDLLLSGGFNGLNVDDVPGTRLVSNHPSIDRTSWEVQWKNASTEDQDQVQVIVLCARQ